MYKVGVTAGLQAVFDEGLQGAKTEASSVAKVAAYKHYMLIVVAAVASCSS